MGTIFDINTATERQTPKKVLNLTPIMDLNGRIFAYFGDCPVCKQEKLYSGNANYCHICGQKLDWEG